MGHDIDRLKAKIDRLDQSLAGVKFLGAVLGNVIHRPGWTTVAEFALVETALDTLQRQVEAAADHYHRLVEAAGLVGSG
jgi:hypothetical protein